MLLTKGPCLTKQGSARWQRRLPCPSLKQTARRRPEGRCRRPSFAGERPTRVRTSSGVGSCSTSAARTLSAKRTELCANNEAVLPLLRAAAMAVVKMVGAACVCACVLNSLGGCSAVSSFACVCAQEAHQGITMMPAWTGLSAGFLHTLAGPDHLAGLAPLTLGQKQAAAVSMGALWGFGHSSGQLLLGIVFLILKGRFHGIVPFLSKWAGAVVGLTLIGIGAMGIYECKFENHDAHEADGETQAVAQLKDRSLARRGLGTYAMGFVYGLQPDSLFVVLPALTLPTKLATLSYVVMFVIGTVCAMAGYTLAIGTASETAVQRRPWLLQHMSMVAASIALIVGIGILLPSLGCSLPFVA